MLKRLTDEARRAVRLAEDNARLLNHGRIGTEHLLLGLIEEGDGLAAQVLGSLGVSLPGARERAEAVTGRGPGPSPARLSWTPRARKALELSLREALRTGHNNIGTEHILLGLLRAGDGTGMQVLASLDVGAAQLRQQLLDQARNGHTASPPGPAAAGGARRRLSELLRHVESMDARLSAVEQRLENSTPAAPAAEIARLRRAKEAAASAEAYEEAAALRDAERELLATPPAGRAAGGPAAESVQRLREEVTRLRALLRRHGIDPQDGAA
jgi:hypothetical protein